MDNKDVVDIGFAQDLTVDKLCRTLVSEMFQRDKDSMVLAVALKGKDAPVVEFELRLISIGGVYPAGGHEDASK
jgi:hypothetical protein